jgi:hypothetical protein
VLRNLNRYVAEYLPTQAEDIKLGTPLFWSTFGQRRERLVGLAPIDHSTRKPHDYRFGVATEMCGLRNDSEEQVCGLR